MQSRMHPRSLRNGRGAVAWGFALGGLSLLLVLPVLALCRLASQVDWRLLIAVPLGMSLITFLAYWRDKRRAEAGEWRIPEFTLHIAEFLGGWPGAFLGQRLFRHKVAKTSYQLVFWMAVLIHQGVALDSLLDWRLTKQAVHFIKSQAG
jgi:uncharacterized membrane protein YsdA (DUF1294 family)